MRFRLTPTVEQEQGLLKHCADARFMWNVGLEQMNCYRPAFGPTPNYNEQSSQLTEARAKSGWLAAGSQTVQQQALKDLRQAFQNWWKNPGHYGRPTWRRYGIHVGFRIVGAQAHRWERTGKKVGRVLVPKVGWVTFRWSRHPGQPKSYRVKQDRAGKWWISFAVVPDQIDGPGDGSVVGIDRGVAKSFVTSDGKIVQSPQLTDSERKTVLRLKRKLSRQQKGSANKAKTLRRIARIEHRAINRRKDCIEKFTTELARTADIVKIEDLNIANMTRSASGTVEEPGTNVAQKRGLNRSILQQGWGLFATRLEHKIGDRLVKVPAAYTSQRCNPCGHTATENRESQAGFRCRSCGHTENADVNAARNIADGLPNERRDSLPRHCTTPKVDVRSMKQEPPQHALTA